MPNFSYKQSSSAKKSFYWKARLTKTPFSFKFCLLNRLFVAFFFSSSFHHFICNEHIFFSKKLVLSFFCSFPFNHFFGIQTKKKLFCFFLSHVASFLWCPTVGFICVKSNPNPLICTNQPFLQAINSQISHSTHQIQP